MADENETKIRDAVGPDGTESPTKSPADVRDLSDLLERVVAAKHADADLDRAIHKAFPSPWQRLRGRGRPENIPQYTASVDVVIGLIGWRLPGWIYRLCVCSVSDDAWVCPDFNHPTYGAEFQARFNDAFDGRDPAEVIMEATDIARHPSGHPALTLLEAMLRGVLFVENTPNPPSAFGGHRALTISRG